MKKVPSRFVYPVVLVMILDFVFTVIGQPAEYWTNYSYVNEGSPLGFGLMRINPIFFLLFCGIYLFAAVTLVRKLPLFLGEMVGLSLFLGHVWGSSTWVNTLASRAGLLAGNFSDWYLVVGYFILLSAMSVLLVTRLK